MLARSSARISAPHHEVDDIATHLGVAKDSIYRWIEKKGLRLLEDVPNAPSCWRAGRARRQMVLAWERLVALATGTHAKVDGAAEDDPAAEVLH